MVKKNLRLSGFTLPELLVVLVIIGILVLLALPSLMPLISKTRSIEAKQALNMVYRLQQTYQYEYAKYSTDLDQIGFEQEPLVSEDVNGSSHYRIELLDVSPAGYRARATAVTDFDNDGQFNVWEINQDGNLVELTRD